MMTLLIVLLVADALALMWLATRRDFSPILSVALALAFIFWWVTPVVTTLGFWDRVSLWAVVTRARFIDTAVLEAGALLAILLLLAIGGRTFGFVLRSILARVTFRPTTLSILIVGGVVAELVLRQILWRIVGTSYWEANAFAVRSEGTVEAANLGVVSFAETVVRAFLYACALSIAPPRSRLVTTVLWAGILIASAQEILAGGRFALLNPVILALMNLHARRLSLAALAAWYSMIAVFIGTVGVFVLIAVAAARGSDAVTVESAREAQQQNQQQALVDQAWGVFDQVNFKFDSISMGGRLIESFRPGTAGWRPYQGAALAIVPRLILPSKPVPSSSTGTNLGVPARLVAANIGYAEDVGNVTVSPAAISVWELKWFGVAIYVVLNVLQLRFINSLLLVPSLPARTLGLFLIGIPMFAGLVAPGDVIVMNGERMLLVYGLLALCFWMPKVVPRAWAASATTA
jgi:hypothetical protein